MFLLRLAALLCAICYCSASSARTGGDWLVYQTDGHIKSNGINLRIKYPRGWIAQEGSRPHVVQKFTSPDGIASAIVLIQDLAISPESTVSPGEAELLFTPSEMKRLVPEGAEIIGTEKTEIEGLPAGIIEYKAAVQRASIGIDYQVWALNFIFDRSLVQIQFHVAGASGQIDTITQMQAHKPIFLSMANSVVLPDKWNTIPAKQPLANTNASVNAAAWPASLLLIWVIGLFPPLVIRFVILRRPVGKVPAIVICVFFAVFNLLLFTLFGSQSKSHVAVTLIVFASYAILSFGRNSRQPENTNKVRLGAATEPVSDELVSSIGMQAKKGVVVIRLMPGSPAENAGLTPNDIITSIDGRAVSAEHNGLVDALSEVKPGTKSVFKILRNSQEIELSVFF